MARAAAPVLIAGAVVAGACSSSEPAALSCQDYLDATPDERRTLVSSAWGDRVTVTDPPPSDDIQGFCQQSPDRLLAPVLDVLAATGSSSTTTEVDAPVVDELTVRAALQVIPVVKQRSDGAPSALAEISADCVAESVAPATVASARDTRVVVADDEVCYRLGPVLFAARSIDSVAVEADENGAARRLRLQLAGGDVERFGELTGEAAVAGPDVPTGQLAFFLSGALLDVVLVREEVGDGVVTLRAADGSFRRAIVEIFERMTVPG